MSEVFTPPSHWLVEPISVDVVGAGGTGSQLLDGLASLESTLVSLGHPGFRVRVFDPDTVSRFNLGRQRFTSADIGLAKAEVLTHRINLFYGRRWQAFPRAYEADDLVGDVRGRETPDLAITAVDSVAARVDIARVGVEMAEAAAELGMEPLWLDTGNSDATGQVVLGHLAPVVGGHGQRRLPHVLDLYSELAEQEHEADDGPSCSMEEAISEQEWPVNRAASMIALDLLWALLRHGEISWHGATFGLNPLSVEPIPIDPVTWSIFGYEADDETPPQAEAA